MGSRNETRAPSRHEVTDDEPTHEVAALDGIAPADDRPVVDAVESGLDPNLLALRRVDAEIRQIMESWLELEHQLANREAEIARLREQGRNVGEEVQATRNELAAARSECERVREEVAAQRSANEAQLRMQEKYLRQAETAQRELTKALGHIGDLENEVTREKSVRDALEFRLAEHRDALTGMAGDIRTFEKARNGHDHDKAALAARIADLERQSAELASRWQESEERFLTSAGRTETLESELTQVREAAAHLDKTLQEKAAVATQLKELQRDLKVEREKAAGLQKQLKAGEQAVKETETALANQRQKTETALNAASRSEQVLDEQNARLATFSEIELKVTALVAELATARDAAAVTTGERDRLSATVSGLREMVSTLEAERADLNDQLDEHRAQFSAIDSEFQAKCRSIAAVAAEFDRLGLIQANVRKLDGMMTRQLAGGRQPDGEAERPPNVRLVVSLDGDKAVKYPLCKPDMVIGRSRDTDIRIAGPHTSRRHARIFVDGGVVMIEDLGSLNGISVNKTKVRRHELHDGDVLDVGGAKLRFVDLDEKSAAPQSGMAGRG